MIVLQAICVIAGLYVLWYLMTRTRRGHFDLIHGLAFDRTDAPRRFVAVQIFYGAIALFLFVAASG